MRSPDDAQYRISAFTRVCDAPSARLRASATRYGGALRIRGPVDRGVGPGSALHRFTLQRVRDTRAQAPSEPETFRSGSSSNRRRPYLAIEASSHAGADLAGLSGRADTRPRRTDNPETVLFDMFAVACAGRQRGAATSVVAQMASAKSRIADLVMRPSRIGTGALRTPRMIDRCRRKNIPAATISFFSFRFSVRMLCADDGGD